MTTVKMYYQGLLRTEATHINSGKVIVTDAPLDNHGKGESFSPTDLLATSLGTCMLTLIGLAGVTHGFSIDGTRVAVTKTMAANPRRVKEIEVVMEFPEINYSDQIKKIIETAARTCPVALSLHPDIKQEVILKFFNS